MADVAPTAQAGGPYAVTAGQPLTLHGAVTDPDPADTAAGFTDTWNFGDGTPTVSGLNLTAPTHTYASAGTYTVTVTATDKDKATSAPATASVTVATATVNPAQINYITTMTDKIPDFGTHPTVWSVASGNWSNPTTWSTGTVPTAGAIVDIMNGDLVIFDLANSPTYNTVEVQNGGDLNFRTNASSTLNVGNLEVLQGGCFCIGTPTAPIPANITDQVIFADQPINTTIDPSSYGTGLIDFGMVNLEGAAKTSEVTLAKEVHAGDTDGNLGESRDWLAGWRSADLPGHEATQRKPVGERASLLSGSRPPSPASRPTD